MCWDCSPDAELGLDMSFFSNFLRPAKLCGRLYRRPESRPPKIGILGKLTPLNTLPPKKYKGLFKMQNFIKIMIFP